MREECGEQDQPTCSRALFNKEIERKYKKTKPIVRSSNAAATAAALILQNLRSASEGNGEESLSNNSDEEIDSEVPDLDEDSDNHRSDRLPQASQHLAAVVQPPCKTSTPAPPKANRDTFTNYADKPPATDDISSDDDSLQDRSYKPPDQDLESSEDEADMTVQNQSSASATKPARGRRHAPAQRLSQAEKDVENSASQETKIICALVKSLLADMYKGISTQFSRSVKIIQRALTFQHLTFSIAGCIRE